MKTTNNTIVTGLLVVIVAIVLAILYVLHGIGDVKSNQDMPLSGAIDRAFGKSATSSAVSVSTASVRVLSTSTNEVNCPTGDSGCYRRGYAAIGNPSAQTCYLKLDQDKPAFLTQGILLAASSTYEIDPDNLYFGSVQAICSAATTLVVTEFR